MIKVVLMHILDYQESRDLCRCDMIFNENFYGIYDFQTEILKVKRINIEKLPK